MKFHLPALSFEFNALDPNISAETFEYHYGKHHQAYVNNLNNLIEDTEFADMDLEDIILKSEGGVFNNAAQTWNHTFYFGQMSPAPKTAPTGELLAKIEAVYGTFDAFKEAFTKAAATLFGSGWAWLVMDQEGELAIMQTTNAANPMTEGFTPLLVCDVWEHAYYIDYRNRRPDYIASFWNVLDWTVIENRLSVAE